MQKNNELNLKTDNSKVKSAIKKFVFSPFMINKSDGQKIAIIGIMTAINFVMQSFIEIPILDVQFSLTFAVCIFAGVFLGAGCGFASSFIADLIGVLLSGKLYMPWVGLSTACMSLIAGLVFMLKGKSIKALYLKATIVVVATFLVCSIAINSTGFYFYNRAMGFSTAFLDYASKMLGKGMDFLLYVAYRMFIKSQILNSIFNYAVFYAIIPLLKKYKIC